MFRFVRHDHCGGDANYGDGDFHGIFQDAHNSGVSHYERLNLTHSLSSKAIRTIQSLFS